MHCRGTFFAEEIETVSGSERRGPGASGKTAFPEDGSVFDTGRLECSGAVDEENGVTVDERGTKAGG